MMLILFAALALPQAAEAQPDDIVVTAKRQSCQAYYRGETLSNRKLEQYAREWRDGRPVRVRAPSHADYRCLAEVAFKLGRKGIRMIEFVQPGTR